MAAVSSRVEKSPRMLRHFCRLCARWPHHSNIRWGRGRSLSSGNVTETANPFPVIKTTFEPGSNVAQRNLAVNTEIFQKVTETRSKILSLDDRVTQIPRGQRKLTVREKISLLKDEESAVLELSMFAGLGLPYGDIYNGSNILTLVKIAGELCIISANDWTFKGGTAYPISVKKQLRAQEISKQNRLPCVYIVDSGGAFLPLQEDVFPDKNHGGRVFRNQAVLTGMGIPQIAVVCGSCTAGGAYIPTMSDEAVIVKGTGSLYLGGPPLVKAATGEEIDSEALGGADVHCGISGCTDHYAESEEVAYDITRRIVASLNLRRRDGGSRSQPESPLYSGSQEDFARLIPATSLDSWPIMEVVARLVDGSRFHSFKEKYGPTLATGFARIDGHLVGLLASNGELTTTAATKGAHFVRLCTLRAVPLVFLQNTPSDAQFLSKTGNDGATVKARAQMMAAIACSTVPKITIVLGGSYGPSSYAMCGRAMQPNFLFCWPHSRVGVASPEDILQASAEQGDQRDSTEVVARLQAEEREHPSSNLVNDGVILPQETRQVLSQCLEACQLYSQEAPLAAATNQLSVLRM